MAEVVRRTSIGEDDHDRRRRMAKARMEKAATTRSADGYDETATTIDGQTARHMHKFFKLGLRFGIIALAQKVWGYTGY